MMKKIVYLTGMPRSGSTLLANVLAMHPKISATPSSPLCSIIQGMRRQWSDDPFLLSQLDDNFDKVNRRLKRSTISFMQAWSDETDKPIVLDKNRGWLMMLETLKELDPEFKMIITLRDLRRIYASVEKRHRKTFLLDFPDHLEHNLVDVRASALFADSGIIGHVLKGLQNIIDVPDIAKHLYYWRYEDFINNPKEIVNTIFKFLEVEETDIDFENICQSTQESDSYYRMKYPHVIKNALIKPEEIPVSPRILNEITNRYRWYYETYYSDIIRSETTKIEISEVDPVEEEMVKKIELAIQEEIK